MENEEIKFSNIFELLNKGNFVYAVVKGQVKMALSSNYAGSDWFIVTSELDARKSELKKLDFHPCDYKNVLAHTMTNADVDFFKNHQENFVNVLQDENGKVYEQKSCSFKKYHENLIKNKKRNGK